MADEDKVIFDRKTAEVLLDMARWWQTNGPPKKKPQPPPSGRGGIEMRLAETVDAIAKGATATATLFGGTTTGSETDLEVEVEVYNRRYAEIATGKKVLIAWIAGGWEVLLVIDDACVDLSDPASIAGYNEGVDQAPYVTAEGCWALEDIVDC